MMMKLFSFRFFFFLLFNRCESSKKKCWPTRLSTTWFSWRTAIWSFYFSEHKRRSSFTLAVKPRTKRKVSGNNCSSRYLKSSNPNLTAGESNYFQIADQEKRSKVLKEEQKKVKDSLSVASKQVGVLYLCCCKKNMFFSSKKKKASLLVYFFFFRWNYGVTWKNCWPARNNAWNKPGTNRNWAPYISNLAPKPWSYNDLK